MILYLDTATGSKWNWRTGPFDKSQPHMIRCSARLCDKDGALLGAMNSIVRPLPGWSKIDADMFALHHISDEYADENGVVLGVVTTEVWRLVRQAKLIVAHNADFHKRVLRRSFAETGVDGIEMPAFFCTMRQSADIVQVRLQGNGQWKWPTLAEAYQFFAGKPLVLPDDPFARGEEIVRAVEIVHLGVSARGPIVAPEQSERLLKAAR